VVVSSVIDEYDRLLRDGSWHMSRVVTTDDDGQVSLRVQARSAESKRVALCFDGVVQLVFRQECGFPVDLQIIDVGCAGWEGLGRLPGMHSSRGT
jgi:hypothetical protein